MREIKFRAWVKPTKKEKGELFNVIMITLPVGGEMILSGKGGSVMAEDCEIMQYTGLKDKNGKEIYEGDVVKAFCNINKISDPHISMAEPQYSNKYVEYINGAFKLSTSEFPNGGCGILNNYCGAMSKDLEVIGNIYENSELLTK